MVGILLYRKCSKDVLMDLFLGVKEILLLSLIPSLSQSWLLLFPCCYKQEKLRKYVVFFFLLKMYLDVEGQY